MLPPILEASLLRRVSVVSALCQYFSSLADLTSRFEFGWLDGAPKGPEEASRIRDLQLRRFVRREVAQLERLSIGGRQGAADDLAIEDDHGVLGLVSVFVADAEAVAAEYAGDARRAYLESGLLAHLARECVRRCLPRIDRARRESPLTIVR